MFSCPTHHIFMDWHWLTIFGTWVFHHETKCRVHSWSRINLELSPQGQIYRVFDMFFVPPIIIFCFDIGYPYLAHGSITIRRCDTYIHVPDFDVDLWPQGKIHRLLSCLHVRPVTSVSFDIRISYLSHGSITMRGCVEYIHDPDTTLTFDFKVKFITGSQKAVGYMIWKL